MESSTTENLPSSLDVPDVFQPRELIDKKNEALADLYKELNWMASGRTGQWHPEVYVSGVENDELTHPEAEFVAVADYNANGSDVTFKGVKFTYMGYAPIINCSIYRNPKATVKLYDVDPLNIPEEPKELQSPVVDPNITPSSPLIAGGGVNQAPPIPSINQDEEPEETDKD